MNLQLLFKEQQLLRDKIAYNEPDRFEKLILALLVELGECANEWRGFKFWSANQKPRTNAVCLTCNGGGQVRSANYPSSLMPCYACNSTGSYGNPLLEEYVDGLHFVLELGLEDSSSCVYDFDYKPYICIENDINTQFVNLFFEIKTFATQRILDRFIEMYLGLGQMLGFTWEQILQAYMEKNAINHERQEQGY